VAVGKFGFQVLAKSAMEHTNEGFVKIVSEKNTTRSSASTSSARTRRS